MEERTALEVKHDFVMGPFCSRVVIIGISGSLCWLMEDNTLWKLFLAPASVTACGAGRCRQFLEGLINAVTTMAWVQAEMQLGGQTVTILPLRC